MKGDGGEDAASGAKQCGDRRVGGDGGGARPAPLALRSERIVEVTVATTWQRGMETTHTPVRLATSENGIIFVCFSVHVRNILLLVLISGRANTL